VPDVPARADAIRDAAGAWATFWTGRLDFDELAWAVNECLGDLGYRLDRPEKLLGQFRLWRVDDVCARADMDETTRLANHHRNLVASHHRRPDRAGHQRPHRGLQQNHQTA
jgi:hypothetical protein